MDAAVTAFLTFAHFVVAVYLISGLDDVLFDLYFWVFRLRRLFTGRRFPRLTLEWLESREQQPIAILVPAWHESNVIGRMIPHTCKTLRYRNYDIFVGAYPNDPETQRQVDMVTAQFSRVHKIVVSTDGPTTKAHNLNELYGALTDYEASTGRRFEIIVNHDAEDIIHPLSLLLCNYLVPRKDMIQLPVFPAPVSLWNFTYWTYADEFAENHLKDLLVRERAGGFVPSAGVGTACTRRAFELMGMLGGEEIFATQSLTEDYLFGLRMRLEGLRCAFVIQRIPMREAVRGGRQDRVLPWIATQALFPRELTRAVRQKTRWNLGIALQTWRTMGWPGNLWVRWNLLHDRKVLLTNVVSFLGYALFSVFVLYESVGLWYFPDLPPLIAPESLLWSMIYAATGIMAWRLFHRVVSVHRIYGFWPAVTAIPRTVWGNFINFAAVLRAMVQFAQGRRGPTITWDKTEHEFPAVTALESVPRTEGARPLTARVPTSEPVAIEEEAMAHALDRDLRAQDEGTRRQAVRRIPRELGRRMLPALLERVRDDSWRVRAEACRSLGFFQFPEAAPDLEVAATDPSWVVRSNAAKALTKLGDAGEQALLNLLRGRDRYAREAALAMLEQSGFISVNLRRLLGKDPAASQKGREFFAALERFGPSRLARETLRRAGLRADADPPLTGTPDPPAPDRRVQR